MTCKRGIKASACGNGADGYVKSGCGRAPLSGDSQSFHEAVEVVAALVKNAVNKERRRAVDTARGSVLDIFFHAGPVRATAQLTIETANIGADLAGELERQSRSGDRLKRRLCISQKRFWTPAASHASAAGSASRCFSIKGKCR